jgi:hypothetical protein
MQRNSEGRYTFAGNLNRLCVCGHTLANHSAGDDTDCIFYSLPEAERAKQAGAEKPNCGCAKFRPSRKTNA